VTTWEVIDKATTFIAEEMGVMLKKSALSPNIRERMDHSCAIIDNQGRIVAQAEHIPVHLGSFKVAVVNVLKYLGDEIKPGENYIFNDPYISGTHLNDVGLLTPIDYEGKIVGYVVNKAHQVDVGGPIPGSLNPLAKTLYEEGIVIPPVKLDERVIKIIKENFKMPEVSIGDLRAQLSANSLGVIRVRQLIEKYGLQNVVEGWDETIEYTRNVVSNINWKEGDYRAEDYLEWEDKLLPIKLTLKVRKDRVTADFSGTHGQIDGPLNAVYGVTYSAVSFAIRSALGKSVSTNEGFYSFVQVKADEGTLVNPVKPAPVSGGNVETSQRIADVTFLSLSKFLPVPAASSGTMMNIMMGGFYKGRYWSYYETIGGGSGARPSEDGISAVHSNMTNTLNTPIEVAESVYPLLFTSYTVRVGSGGKGKYKGGDGIIRSFKVLSPTRLALMADRFIIGPWGLNGGERGKPGKATVRKRSDELVSLKSKCVVELDEGDEVIIETPGGGGYGSSD